MHIPPYHKKSSWQRIFIGAFFGGIIAYCIFIFMYGTMYERLLEEYYNLQSEVSELKSQNEALMQDKEDLNEQSKKPITVNKIEVHINNPDDLKLDRLLTHQLEEMIKEEINHIIGQDLNIVAQSDELLHSTIENKSFVNDDFTYHFKIKKLIIYKTVEITVDVKLADSM